jgi:hypothetical protein
LDSALIDAELSTTIGLPDHLTGRARESADRSGNFPGSLP